MTATTTNSTTAAIYYQKALEILQLEKRNVGGAYGYLGEAAPLEWAISLFQASLEGAEPSESLWQGNAIACHRAAWKTARTTEANSSFYRTATYAAYLLIVCRKQEIKDVISRLLEERQYRGGLPEYMWHVPIEGTIYEGLTRSGLHFID